MSDCQACDPPPRPSRPDNRSGLSEIDYRLGTFGEFRASMLADVATDPVLSSLTTRSSDDHVITLLDCASAVADVLCFYQDRYANEVFLETASERRSILRLAELVGYRPRPGLAATAWLAFELDGAEPVVLAAGQQVQSIPGPDETPVMFETLRPLVADRRLNRVRAHLSSNPVVTDVVRAGSATAVLDRAAAPDLARSLLPNDHVVTWGNSAGLIQERTVAGVDVVGDRIVVRWTRPLPNTPGLVSARKWTRKLRVFGAGAPETFVKPTTPTPTNASDIRWQMDETRFDVGVGSRITFEGIVDDLPVGTQLLFVPRGAAAAAPTILTVTRVETLKATVGPLSDSATSVLVTPNRPAYDRREVAIYVLDGPALVFWGDGYPSAPLANEIYVPGFRIALADGTPAIEIGRRIERNEWVAGDVLRVSDLERGRPLLVGPVPQSGGDAADVAPVLATVRGAALVPAAGAAGGFCHLRIELDVTGALPGARDEVMFFGNVARASHGETVREVIGSGDATVALQRLALAKKPVTFLAAPVPGGVQSSLEIAVDGTRRREVRSLFGQPGDAAVFESHADPDGNTTVRFGDGRQGARLPTGIANVTAVYRTGSGLMGRVRAGALQTLLGAPVGVSGVTNPLPAEGGADPESQGSARSAAPRGVRTMGRAVSLSDLDDLATESGQLAKASATWVWDGFDRSIHLTVAAQLGAPLSDVALNDIAASLDLARDPNRRMRVSNFAAIPVVLEAKVVVDPGVVDSDRVVAAARAAILAWLSFDAVGLSRPVNLSDAVAVLASVQGVVGVDVDRLGFKPIPARTPAELDARGVARAPNGSVLAVQPRLRMFAARPHPSVPGQILPAELAVVDSPSLDVVISRGVDR